MDHARGDLKSRMTDEVMEAMDKIRKAVISPADITGHQFSQGPQLELRRRYVNMPAADAINAVFINACELTDYSRDLRQLCLALRRVTTDRLGCSLFQLALCSGDLSRPDDPVLEILDSEGEDEEDEDSGPDEEKSPVEPQPTEGMRALRYLWSVYDTSIIHPIVYKGLSVSSLKTWWSAKLLLFENQVYWKCC